MEEIVSEFETILENYLSPEKIYKLECDSPNIQYEGTDSLELHVLI